jgi:hypothetical protein
MDDISLLRQNFMHMQLLITNSFDVLVGNTLTPPHLIPDDFADN